MGNIALVLWDIAGVVECGKNLNVDLIAQSSSLPPYYRYTDETLNPYRCTKKTVKEMEVNYYKI